MRSFVWSCAFFFPTIQKQKGGYGKTFDLFTYSFPKAVLLNYYGKIESKQSLFFIIFKGSHMEKRIIWIIAVISLFFTLLSLPVNADYTQAKYSSTMQFLKILDNYDIKYTWQGMDSDDNEIISIGNNSDVVGNYTIKVFFDDSNENCSIRVWNLIDYKSAMSSSVYAAVNSINYAYKYVKFFADDSDNSVTASIDLIYRDSDIGEICLEALVDIVSIIDKAYPQLEPFAR